MTPEACVLQYTSIQYTKAPWYRAYQPKCRSYATRGKCPDSAESGGEEEGQNTKREGVRGSHDFIAHELLSTVSIITEHDKISFSSK